MPTSPPVLHLLAAHTADGLSLDGLLQRGSAPPRTLALLIHGAGSHALADPVRSIGAELQALGVPALQANTRGAHWVPSEYRARPGCPQQGAAFERLEDAIHDIEAWLRWAQDCGFTRVVLLGHSLGALKALVWAASAKDFSLGLEVEVVALSPVDLSASALQRSFGSEYWRWVSHVRGLGSHVLFHTDLPSPSHVTTGTWLNKCASGSRWEPVALAGESAYPLHVVFGEKELAGFPLTGAALATRFETSGLPPVVLPDTGHSYRGAEASIASLVAAIAHGERHSPFALPPHSVSQERVG